MDHSSQVKQTYKERFRTYTARKVIHGMRAGMGGASPGRQPADNLSTD